MKWFFPQYNGDFRIIAVDNSSYREQADDSACVLEIVDPTAHETTLLESFLADARGKEWTPVSKIVLDEIDGKRRQEILLSTSVASAGKLLYTRIRPADRTITAVTSTGGEIRVYETADLAQIDEALTPDAIIPAKDPETPEEPAAVSVKRPTPSCPQCVPGAIDRASEVLQAFLTPLEHELWARERFIVVEGGLSGHRYMLAHRHSRYAQKVGRICFDLDDDTVVHFHDNSVPPEEEILAAKLILQHREPWLRNEATLFHAFHAANVYKNPFGDFMDGTVEAGQTQAIGHVIKRLLG
jgi:hypothetical protein